ncbi:MAG: CRISPR-associated endonuclease Cas1 [bacterium]|nr:CRISPR-associated endonuclease Cas1 [bacterium]
METNQNVLYNIFSSEQLFKSWENVKSKNKAGGIDNVSIKQFEGAVKENLVKLQNEVVTRAYIPEPYLRFFIKKESGEFRPLALMTIRDKIVQRALLNFYDERIDKTFSKFSYAYRKSKSHLNAIENVQSLLKKGFCFFAHLDIDNYYDCIDRNILIDNCKKHFNNEYILTLLKMWVKTGIVYKEQFIDTPVGIAQGGIVSPLLSNIYLDNLDKELLTKRIIFIRYADNILLVDRKQEMLANSIKFCKDYLESKLKLRINEDRLHIIHRNQGFTFCGIHFKNAKRIIDNKKLEILKEKLSANYESTDFYKYIQDMNETVKGIKYYFSKFDVSDQFNELEDKMIEGLSNYINKLLLRKDLRKIGTIKKVIREINFLKERTSNEKLILENIIIGKLRIYQDKLVSPASVEKSISRKRKKYIEQYYKSVDVMIVKKGSKIGISKDKIIISSYDNQKKEIHADKIKNLIISTEGVSITSNAIKLCCEKKISMNFVDFLGKPFGVLLSNNSPYFSVSILQTEINSSDKGKLVARSIVKSKVKNQLAVLKYFIKNREDLDPVKKYIDSEIENINSNLSKIDNINLAEEKNYLLDVFLGIEGICAVSYWNCFRQLIPDGYDFPGRQTKGTNDPVNMLLNYGYGFLYNRILNSVMIAGLNPHIGFLHREQKQKPTLVFDLIEQFRAPVVDRTVIALLSRKFEIKTEKYYLSEETRIKFAERILLRLNSEITYNKKKLTLNDLIFEKTKDFVKYLKNETANYNPYIFKW